MSSSAPAAFDGKLLEAAAGHLHLHPVVQNVILQRLIAAKDPGKCSPHLGGCAHSRNEGFFRHYGKRGKWVSGSQWHMAAALLYFQGAIGYLGTPTPQIFREPPPGPSLLPAGRWDPPLPHYPPCHCQALHRALFFQPTSCL